MASLKAVLCLGAFLSAGIGTADTDVLPQAENVRWVSLDFKTILTWTTRPSDSTYSVLYSEEDSDWIECEDCSQVSASECDLSNHLIPFDRTYTADIRTEPATMDYNQDPEELPHTYSTKFNPYRESNISAVTFTVDIVDDGRVRVNITDPLTSIHRAGKQLSIRDILKNDLKYKISYYKSGSTGKRDIISDYSVTEVSQLDAGQSYCFMVAAHIPSRPKHTQQGALSKQQCTPGASSGLSLGVWVGVVIFLLTVLIIIITVTVLCCKCCQQRNKTLHTSQSSAPV